MQQQEENEVIEPLKKALLNLEEALQQTVRVLSDEPESNKRMGHYWEQFLGTFFGRVRTVGKENNTNLLNLISFTRLKKF
ncbi:hypothetical protein [Peribacillus kribbensis]|uniref:hypothetical protein n=1 Tax=Peribacillus kribbensis TaxID=356658 RepID=UPI00042243B2|nr:hypothetical protein [Peribacillus kribbensis]